MSYYAGYQIIEDINMTETVPRTWLERLFTTPWKPLQSLKEVPSNSMAIYENKVIMHPQKVEQLKKTFPHAIYE